MCSTGQINATLAIILLTCISRVSSLAINSLPNDTVGSPVLASYNNSITNPISAPNGGPTPPELYVKTNNVRDLQNASLTQGLVKFSNYDYAQGRWKVSFIQDLLLNAHQFMHNDQEHDRQGIDETIEDDYFLYTQADPAGGEVNIIFQSIEGQLETERHTTWRDVSVVLDALVLWVKVWQRADLLVPSTEIVLQVFDGHGYITQASGFLFTIRETSQRKPQDLQTT